MSAATPQKPDASGTSALEGYYRLHSQVQFHDSPTTGCAFTLRAVTPAGRECNGATDGPTYLSPSLSFFHALDETHLKQIVEVQLSGLRERLAERHIQLELTDAARTYLVRSGYDATYGARPLKRAIQKEIETPLARKIISGDVRDGQSIHIDTGEGGLRFETAPAAVAV